MIVNYQLHAANERTFLSWVRTAVAIIGFGFAVARLGDRPSPVWSEVLLLAVGAAVIVLAWLRMRHVRCRINSPDALPDDSAAADLFLIVLVGALFALLAVFAIHVA